MAQPELQDRSPFIDYLKAAAAIAVVVQHSIVPRWHPDPPLLDHILRPLIQFHVPAFLFASGYLYYSSSALGVRAIAARIRRLLPPYIVATVIWALYYDGANISVSALASSLVFADQLPIYYFVHLIVECTAFAWFLSRMNGKQQLVLLSLIMLASGLAAFFPAINLTSRPYWLLRSPINCLAPFIAGWAVRNHADQLVRLRKHWRPVLLVGCLAVIVSLTTLYLQQPNIWRVHWAILRNVYSLTVIGFVACAIPPGTAPVPFRFLSVSSYTIYLYHFPFVAQLRAHVPSDTPPVASIAALTLAGLLAGSALAIIGSRVFGSRSRTIVGAFWSAAKH